MLRIQRKALSKPESISDCSGNVFANIVVTLSIWACHSIYWILNYDDIDHIIQYTFLGLCFHANQWIHIFRLTKGFIVFWGFIIIILWYISTFRAVHSSFLLDRFIWTNWQWNIYWCDIEWRIFGHSLVAKLKFTNASWFIYECHTNARFAALKLIRRI